MRAIILAAGAGRRLGLDGPKSMIDVGGRSILRRQIDAFASVGVDDFVIVVGYQRERIAEHLAGLPGKFTFVVNERFAETNTVYSLYLARQYIPGGFFYANADVVFDSRLVRRLAEPAAVPSEPEAPAGALPSEPEAQARALLSEPGGQATGPPDFGVSAIRRFGFSTAALAVVVGRCAEEEVKVIVRDGRIIRIGKKLNPAECLGEFIGVARFDAELAPAFVAALETCVEQEQAVNDYFERAVDRLCDDWSLTPVDVSDLPCIEIDFPEDLARARQEIIPRLSG